MHSEIPNPESRRSNSSSTRRLNMIDKWSSGNLIVAVNDDLRHVEKEMVSFLDGLTQKYSIHFKSIAGVVR